MYSLPGIAKLKLRFLVLPKVPLYFLPLTLDFSSFQCGLLTPRFCFSAYLWFPLISLTSSRHILWVLPQFPLLVWNIHTADGKENSWVCLIVLNRETHSSFQETFLVVQTGGYSWHVMCKGQECNWISYSAQDSPTTKNYLGQNVNSAKVEKPCPKHRHFFHTGQPLRPSLWYFVQISGEPRPLPHLNLKIVL